MDDYEVSDVDLLQAKARLVKGPLPEGVRVFYVGGLTVEDSVKYAVRKKQEALAKGEGNDTGRDSGDST